MGKEIGGGVYDDVYTQSIGHIAIRYEIGNLYIFVFNKIFVYSKQKYKSLRDQFKKFKH